MSMSPEEEPIEYSPSLSKFTKRESIRKNADRPLECSGCSKEISVYYTEIIGNSTTCTSMCEACPILQQRLHGNVENEHSAFAIDATTGLCCGNCGITLDSVRTGGTLGCSECYEVFSDVIIMELQSAEKISPRYQKQSKGNPSIFHIGRSPGEVVKVNPSIRLVALNEALNETLAKEDYEQAAWLRDQIKELTEEKEGE